MKRLLILILVLLLVSGCVFGERDSTEKAGEADAGVDAGEQPLLPEEPQRFSVVELTDAALPVAEEGGIAVESGRISTERWNETGQEHLRYTVENYSGESYFELELIYLGDQTARAELAVNGTEVARAELLNQADQSFGGQWQVRWLDNYMLLVAFPSKMGLYDAALNEFYDLYDMLDGMEAPVGFWDRHEPYRDFYIYDVDMSRYALVFSVAFLDAADIYRYNIYTRQLMVLENRLRSNGFKAPKFIWERADRDAYYYIGQTDIEGESRGKLYGVSLKNGRKTVLLDLFWDADILDICGGYALIQHGAWPASSETGENWQERYPEYEPGERRCEVMNIATGETILKPEGEYIGTLYDRYFVMLEDNLISFIDSRTDTIYTHNHPKGGTAILRESVLGTPYLEVGGESRLVSLAGMENYL